MGPGRSVGLGKVPSKSQSDSTSVGVTDALKRKLAA